METGIARTALLNPTLFSTEMGGGGSANVLSGVGEADSGGQWGRLAESALTDLKAFQAGGIQVVTVFSVLFVALSVPTR